MNTHLLRNSSLLVLVSVFPYKYVPIYMYICYGYVTDTYPYISTIVKNTYDSNSLEFDQKYKMFEFVLMIRVSFVLVGPGRIPRRCATTVLFWKLHQFILSPASGDVSVLPYFLKYFWKHWKKKFSINFVFCSTTYCEPHFPGDYENISSLNFWSFSLKFHRRIRIKNILYVLSPWSLKDWITESRSLIILHDFELLAFRSLWGQPQFKFVQ